MCTPLSGVKYITQGYINLKFKDIIYKLEFICLYFLTKVLFGVNLSLIVGAVTTREFENIYYT